MNKAEEHELGRYIRCIANEMGLRDWHLILRVVDELDEGGMRHHEDDKLTGVAQCSVTTGQNRAVISFRHDSREEMSLDEIREIVVHELVHCHLHDMREFLRTGLLNSLAQATYDAITYGHDLAWEHAVDSIARSWATKFPPVKWPAKKRRRRR